MLRDNARIKVIGTVRDTVIGMLRDNARIAVRLLALLETL
jgi:hypothetical protein